MEFFYGIQLSHISYFLERDGLLVVYINSLQFCIQTRLKIAALDMQGLKTKIIEYLKFKINVGAFFDCCRLNVI